MNTATILNKAADLIEKKGWTRGDYAVDEKGNEVATHSRRAVKFCARGAIYRAAGPDLLKVDDAIAELEQVIANRFGSISWNDRQKSKRPVIAALRKAAKRAAKK